MKDDLKSRIDALVDRYENRVAREKEQKRKRFPRNFSGASRSRHPTGYGRGRGPLKIPRGFDFRISTKEDTERSCKRYGVSLASPCESIHRRVA
jgi:hypothetical protein